MTTQFRFINILNLAALIQIVAVASPSGARDEAGRSHADASSQTSLVPLPKAGKVDFAKAQLGFELFSDKRLSHDDTRSCASCHDLSRYGSDHVSFSSGWNGKPGEANTPSIFNSSLNFVQFWDGRAKNLEEQVPQPIHNPVEMGSSWSEVMAKISKDAHYLEKFQKVFGRAQNSKDLVDAIVEFEKTLLTPNSALDRYLRGQNDALNEQQLAGLKKFESFGCISCHQGVNIGGNMFQTMGVMSDYFAQRGGGFPSDRGRSAVTGRSEDLHVFRVPSLRNVAETAPYFHDGQAKTLREAVKIMGKYQLGQDLSSEDVNDLVEFLRALTGDRPEILSRLKIQETK